LVEVTITADAVIGHNRRLHIFAFRIRSADSEDFARRLDIPISAVPSMMAAIPVVEPSAADVEGRPGCSAFEVSANCGTSFAAECVGTLMTRRSAFA